MGFPKLIALFALLSLVNALPSPQFQPNNYPQNQVDAWGQACRSFQQQQLQTQFAQNQFFGQNFPQIALPPLPFMDICGQFGGGGFGGGFAQSGAGAGASSGGFGTANRFGGSDGGFQGVSVSSGSLPNGQQGTSFTQFGPNGASVSHFSSSNNGGGSNGGGFATANRFGGANAGQPYGNYGTGGFSTGNRFGGASGAAGVSSFGGNGGSFATASRFGDDGAQTFSAQGPHGAGVSVSSTNDGRGNVHTQVNKHQY